MYFIGFYEYRCFTKKEENSILQSEKEKRRVQRFSHPHKENCPGRNVDEVTDNLPPSKEALNRAKLKKQKERDVPKNGGEIRRKVGILCPLSRFVFLIHWAKAKHNSF